MPVIVHVVLASLYVLLALVVVALFWWLGGDLGIGLSLGIGGAVGLLVLLSGALMHDSFVRRRKEKRNEKEIASLRDAFGEVTGELQALKTELTAPRLNPRSPVFGLPVVDGYDPTAGELVPEVQEMQSLLHRVTQDRTPEAWETARAQAEIARRNLSEEEKRRRRALLRGLDEPKLLSEIENALRHDRLDLYIQPVVALPVRSRAFFEASCLIRTSDGEHILPEQYRQIAEEAGVIGHIENFLLLRTLQLVRSGSIRNQRCGLFCHISGATLADPQFLLDFVKLMEDNAGILGNRLVFCIGQRDLDALPDITNRALYRLTGAGYRFCLDHVHKLVMDLEELRDRRFRFIKLPAPLLRLTQQKLGQLPKTGAQAGSGGQKRDLKVLRRAFDRNALDLIIERLDTQDDVLEMLDFTPEYGQGVALGEPRPAFARPDPATTTIEGEDKPGWIVPEIEEELEDLRSQGAPDPRRRSEVEEDRQLTQALIVAARRRQEEGGAPEAADDVQRAPGARRDPGLGRGERQQPKAGPERGRPPAAAAQRSSRPRSASGGASQQPEPEFSPGALFGGEGETGREGRTEAAPAPMPRNAAERAAANRAAAAAREEGERDERLIDPRRPPVNRPAVAAEAEDEDEMFDPPDGPVPAPALRRRSQPDQEPPELPWIAAAAAADAAEAEAEAEVEAEEAVPASRRQPSRDSGGKGRRAEADAPMRNPKPYPQSIEESLVAEEEDRMAEAEAEAEGALPDLLDALEKAERRSQADDEASRSGISWQRHEEGQPPQR